MPNLPLKTTNRIARPKDYSKIDRQFYSYSGDLQEPQFVNVRDDTLDSNHYRIDDKLRTDAYNSGGTFTYTLEFEGSGGTIKDIQIGTQATAGTESYNLNFYINDVLIYSTSRNVDVTAVFSSIGTDIEGSRENNGDRYKLVAEMTSPGLQTTSIYVRRFIYLDY